METSALTKEHDVRTKTLSFTDGSIPQGCGTVMLVDDEEGVLKIARKILDKSGYSTLCFLRGKDAVEVFSERHEDIDLVLLDMIMPDMDGLEVFRELKEINPDVKVVLSSGFSIGNQAEELLREGVNGFLQKPFTIIGLCNTIKTAMESADSL